MSRAAELASLRLPSCALGARLFPPSKWAGLFPSAAYRRSAPAQSAVGRLTPCGLGCFGAAGRFCGVDERAAFLFPAVDGGQAPPLAGWDTSVYLGYFCNAKGQREIKITLAFVASHEACRRMAVWVGHQTGSYARPASREARRRAAVIPRPTGFPTSSPAPYGRGVGCRGTTPARPASREARCRAAVSLRPSRMSREQPRAQRARCGVQGYYPCWRDSFSNWRV